MANKVGPLIKEARTAAKLSQEALAAKVDGVSASDISKAERGEKELTQAALKQIAKATGVTQKSLLEAAAASTYSSGKTSSGKTSSSSSSKKTSSKKSVQLTTEEKRLVELFRKADEETQKSVLALLKGTTAASDTGELLSSALTGIFDLINAKKDAKK